VVHDHRPRQLRLTVWQSKATRNQQYYFLASLMGAFFVSDVMVPFKVAFYHPSMALLGYQ
jgi:hypothetical protein